MRTLLLTLVYLLPTLASATIPSYSRMIVFGDSLSDIGNMPESPNLIEPSYHAIALNLYVPISNPSVNFWNGAHPTMYLNQVVANDLLIQLQNQKKLTNT